MKSKKYIFIILISVMIITLLMSSNSLFSQNMEQVPITEFKSARLIIDTTKAKVNKRNALTVFTSRYQISNDFKFRIDAQKTIEKDKLGFSHERYEQYYKGVKIEFSDIRLHYKGEVFVSANGEYLPSLKINTQPQISEETALQHALEYINAEEYIWQLPSEEQWLKRKKNDNEATFYPKAEIVICKDRLSEINYFKLAYKFDIYATIPLSRDFVFVDASNGEIIRINPIMVSVAGTAATRYSGARTIETEQSGSVYILLDSSRGNGVATYNLNNSTTLSSAVDFEDNNNDWTAAEYDNGNKDNAALDAHWGLMMTYDYFNTVHNRNSFDNAGALIESYVHYDINLVNAYWTGNELLIGDGDGIDFDPLTSVDIVAHEFGHAVCENTANLAYELESGAINEGLSDIWGACVENYADATKDTWAIGEDVDLRTGHSGGRSMSNPNAEQQPDTYSGTWWFNVVGCVPVCDPYDPDYNDCCGVHTNSGVMNHWFYLLSEGGADSNDNGDAFDISGIGIGDAAEIIYRAESVYMTANTTFANARTHTIEAAEDLFGLCSQEIESVSNAWYAVGVGDSYDPTTVLENTTISTNTTIENCNIDVENVTVESGATLTLNYGNSIIINGEFEAELGSALDIK
ncbi:MAG: M4 family metallopeptidase [Bacteroidota bacterium]